MSKFKAGDRVRVVKVDPERRIYNSGMLDCVGEEFEVTGYSVLQDFVYTCKWTFYGDDVELVEPKIKCEITGLDCDPGCKQCTLGDPVKPAHYTASDIEPIDAIEAWELGFCLGNVVKYVARHAHKGDPLGDLKKAAWYLDRAIKEMEK